MGSEPLISAVREVIDDMRRAADRDERDATGEHRVTRFDARNWAENLLLAVAAAEADA